jgi:hypothetical protein
MVYYLPGEFCAVSENGEVAYIEISDLTMLSSRSPVILSNNKHLKPL